MNLILDIGNTSVKVAQFLQNKIVSVERFSDKKELFDYLKKCKYSKSIVSSVRKDKFLKETLQNVNNTLVLDGSTSSPIKNKYKTPKTLGYDRLANVVAAYSLNPYKNTLTIDAGTCLKFDMVTNKGEYNGGAISLGLNMRFKALNNFTGKLPLIEPSVIDYYIGRSTEESIKSGVVNGCLQEIKGVINQYKQDYKNLEVILTGGDCDFFDKALKNTIFVSQNLTLIGLNSILEHQ